MFCEEQSSCDNWTEGLGTAKASKIVSEVMKGRAPNRVQIGAIMIGFVEGAGTLPALDNDGRGTLGDESCEWS